jgi:hypothetical protein
MNANSIIGARKGIRRYRFASSCLELLSSRFIARELLFSERIWDSSVVVSLEAENIVNSDELLFTRSCKCKSQLDVALCLRASNCSRLRFPVFAPRKVVDDVSCAPVRVSEGEVDATNIRNKHRANTIKGT